MADIKWIKLTTDMFDNRKVKHLRRLPKGNNIVLIWVMLLTMAGRCNSGGMIFLTENIPYTPKMLADELDFEENTVLLALQALEQLDMIVTDNGFFTIAGWEEYQNIEGLEKIREQTRKRVAKCRERKMLSQGSVTSNVTVTDSNAIEEEKEEEGEKEKEFQSFIHTAAEADYIERKIEESNLEGSDAEVYKSELKESLKQRFFNGTLGKGVVFMSDEQFQDLIDKLGGQAVDKYFGIVAEEELKGHHYKKKTHYQAMLDMAMKDRKIEQKG